jgi:hypothetical protein
MKIACIAQPACEQVLGVLKRHGIRRGVSWNGPDGIDTSIWIHVTVPIDPTVKAAIRRDIDAIAAAAVQE